MQVCVAVSEERRMLFRDGMTQHLALASEAREVGEKSIANLKINRILLTL